MRGAQFRLLMTTDAVGGVWQYSTELAGALAEHGFAVVLAVLGPRLAMPQRVQAEALPSVTVIETGLALDWLANAEATRAAADRIAELAREQAVDLVHLNSPALAADAGFNVPVIGVAHGCVSTWWEAARTEPLAPEFHWHRDMTARGLRACDRVIAPTASYAETVRRHYRLA
ncbi:MAG: glycosyltransferase, partial [Novosphingobium sp.]|nr:glycosyltransferase [Novosphingobium sp.]